MAIAFAVTSSARATSVTIATFADPSTNSTEWLFKIDKVNNTLQGGWDDSRTNLTLQVRFSGNTFDDAFFTMTDVTITGVTDPEKGRKTGSGIIKFFQDNADPQSVTPLVQIAFDQAWVTFYAMGAADRFTADGVTITGSEIAPTLSDESFAFSFANQEPLDGSFDNGYTASASFTSSAVPEPATAILLAFGSLALSRTRVKRV
jgi:hypothetical protein